MTSTDPSQDNLADEFRRLGKNLAQVIQAAWDSPERKQFQQEIENGLRDLGSTVKQQAQGLKENATTQRVKSEFEDTRERIRSGEAEARLRADLIAALHLANQALQRASERWSAPGQAEQPSEPQSGPQGGPESGAQSGPQAGG